MPYDVSLGGVSFPTYDNEFTETVGSDYELVGAAVMPGPPRPLGFYDMSIRIHSVGSDPASQGDTIRNAIRSILQNNALRAAGLAFSSAFDSSLNGYLVIGTADIAYSDGGPGFSDYVLKLSAAAHIGSPESLLSVHRVTLEDRRLATVPVDHLRRAHSPGTDSKKKPLAVHYLPPGARDIVGQVKPELPETKTYRTIFGDAVAVEDRQHGEILTFDHAWEDRYKGDVRIFDRMGDKDPEFDRAGDLDPKLYGWAQGFGPTFILSPGDVPVMDNGVCRVRYTDGSSWQIDALKGDSYTLDSQSFSLGYSRLLGATIAEYTRERGVLRVVLAGAKGRANVFITLQRGWKGPAIDVYWVGEKPQPSAEGALEHDGDGWIQLRFGTNEKEFLAGVVHEQVLAAR
jgi:hypothetical protein